MTRRHAYNRLAVISLAVAAIGSLVARNLALGAILGAIVFATGFLAIELGRRRRRFPDRDGAD